MNNVYCDCFKFHVVFQVKHCWGLTFKSLKRRFIHCSLIWNISYSQDIDTNLETVCFEDENRFEFSYNNLVFFSVLEGVLVNPKKKGKEKQKQPFTDFNFWVLYTILALIVLHYFHFEVHVTLGKRWRDEKRAWIEENNITSVELKWGSAAHKHDHTFFETR